MTLPDEPEEIVDPNKDYIESTNIIMTILAIVCSVVLMIGIVIIVTGCAALPQMFQAAEEIATDTAIKIEVDKEAISKQTDVKIQIDVMNNEPHTTK